MLVGVNGSGKTTSIKTSKQILKTSKKVLLAAGDTLEQELLNN